MFNTILIANRGEIACRVIKTALHMGIKTVAVYSDADQDALHVRMADDAVYIGGAKASESYLIADRIIEAAKLSGAEAIHPGYGFLSENAAFAERCAKEGIVFIGPSAKSIDAMGLKDRAKAIMQDAGVPVVPGYQGDNQDAAFLKGEAEKIGFPVLVKAVAGGGGKGMRRIDSAKTFLEDLESCKREAKAAFGNDAVLIEKYIEKPRHIEVQVFGDSHGNYVHLFERDCSVQRRHQKVVEEAPAPGISEDVRAKIGAIAVKAAAAIDYCGAGTVEFIVDASKAITEKSFYFMEMNTRLQVEHPVSELISGQDFVEWQLLIAAGGEIPCMQDELFIDGHAFELRIYAEDPANNFVPQIGVIEDVLIADMDESVYRLDSGVEAGDQISIYYDPMMAKLICWGESREIALKRLKQALEGTAFLGVRNNQEYLRNIITHPAFVSADVHTHFVPQYEGDLLPANYGQAAPYEQAAAAVFFGLGLYRSFDDLDDPWAVPDNWRMNHAVKKNIRLRTNDELMTYVIHGHEANYQVSVGDDVFDMRLLHMDDEAMAFEVDGVTHHMKYAYDGAAQSLTLLSQGRPVSFARDRYDLHDSAAGGNDAQIVSPMPGTIIKVLVKEGAKVSKDEPLIIMEAMKLEMTLRAPKDGVIARLNHAENDQVLDGAVLLEFSQEEEAA